MDSSDLSQISVRLSYAFPCPQFIPLAGLLESFILYGGSSYDYRRATYAHYGEGEEVFTRRYREANGIASLLHLSRRKRAHGSHPVPRRLNNSPETLEVPIYQLFYDGEECPPKHTKVSRNGNRQPNGGASGKDARTLAKFQHLLNRTKEGDRQLLHLFMARKMARSRLPDHLMPFCPLALYLGARRDNFQIYIYANNHDGAQASPIPKISKWVKTGVRLD